MQPLLLSNAQAHMWLLPQQCSSELIARLRKQAVTSWRRLNRLMYFTLEYFTRLAPESSTTSRRVWGRIILHTSSWIQTLQWLSLRLSDRIHDSFAGKRKRKRTSRGKRRRCSPRVRYTPYPPGERCSRACRRTRGGTCRHMQRCESMHPRREGQTNWIKSQQILSAPSRESAEKKMRRRSRIR